jgi:biotin operon repressor
MHMPAAITNDDVLAFITLVDEAKRSAGASGTGRSGASDVKTTDLPEANQYPGSLDLYGRVHAILLRSDDKQGPNIRQLQGALTKRSVLDPDLCPYRDIVRRLRHGTSNDKRFLDFKERDAWVAAIQLIQQLPDPPLSPTLGLEREVAVATAVKKLRDLGYQIDPHGENFRYRDGELERLCRELHRLAEEIGGHKLLRGLFAYLRETVSMQQGRYLLSRVSRPTSGGNSTPSFPFGYLLQVALKHLGATGRPGDCRKVADALGELATNVVASLDIEHYYILAPMFQTYETLPSYLQEVVVGDHVLTFRQITPADALTLCRGVFSWIDGDLMRSKLGWGPEEAYQLAEHTLTRVPPDAINSVFTRHNLSSSGISSTALDSMRKYFVHKPTEVNVGYLTPLNADKANAASKPFFALPDASFMMVSPPIASIGFYEAIATGARVAFGKADEKIGSAMEGMIAAAFKLRNIHPSVTSGKYRVGSDTHECDLVIESESVLILIELKKKSLTAASYAGNTVTALLDLCLSALHAQLQLGKHELRFREHGKIEFLDGTVVEWRDRRIERISVSLLDWGGTQDRFALQRIAANLVGARLDAFGVTAKQEEDLGAANEILSELQLQQTRLELLGIKAVDQFHNWWFLSVPQLLFVLNRVSGPEAFYDDLRLVRQIHTGTMDFYKDLIHWRQARDAHNRSPTPAPP